MEIIETSEFNVAINKTIQVTKGIDEKYSAIVINYPLFRYLEAEGDSKEGLIEKAIKIYNQMGVRQTTISYEDKWAECDVCDGEHFIVSNDEEGNEEIQKCDECNIFETDADAQKHYKEFH